MFWKDVEVKDKEMERWHGDTCPKPKHLLMFKVSEPSLLVTFDKCCCC